MTEVLSSHHGAGEIIGFLKPALWSHVSLNLYSPGRSFVNVVLFPCLKPFSLLSLVLKSLMIGPGLTETPHCGHSEQIVVLKVRANKVHNECTFCLFIRLTSFLSFFRIVQDVFRKELLEYLCPNHCVRPPLLGCFSLITALNLLNCSSVFAYLCLAQDVVLESKDCVFFMAQCQSLVQCLGYSCCLNFSMNGCFRFHPPLPIDTSLSCFFFYSITGQRRSRVHGGLHLRVELVPPN